MDILNKQLTDLELNLADLPEAKSKFLERYCGKLSDNLFGIDDFIFYQKIGNGSFANVYLGADKATKTEIFAMKVLNKENIIEEQQVDHIKSEKKLLSSLQSLFIITLLHSFQDQTNLYLVLEYMPGGELFRFLRSRIFFGEETAKFYSMQIILAVDYLHELGIVYRDIKPENILISGNGYLKLGDFGFAKLLLDSRTYTLCGTPEYLAPETILNKGYGQSVDWWGIGVLIFELLGGHTPFYSPVIQTIYEKIVYNKYRFPCHFSVESKSIIGKLLDPDTSKRLGNLKNKGEDVKNHKWFILDNPYSWHSIYYQSQLLPKEIGSKKIIQNPDLDESKITILQLVSTESEFSKNLFIDF